MKYVILVILAVALVGCSKDDIARVRVKIDEQKQNVQTLSTAAGLLRQAAESGGDENTIKLAAAAEAALKIAADKIPEMEAELAKLGDGTPGWQVGLAAAWPLILAGLRFVPVVGSALAPIANLAWSAYATKKQKLADA